MDSTIIYSIKADVLIEEVFYSLNDTSDLYYEDGEEKPKSNEKSKNVFLRAVDAVVKFIKGLIDKVKSFFQKMGLSEEEKKEFEEIKKSINSDPEIKNKSFTVADYRKVKQEQEAVLKEMEAIQKAAQAAADEEKEAEIIDNGMGKVKGMMSKIAEFGATAGKSVATALGMQQILHMAESNKNFAIMASNMLEEEEGLAAQLANAVGEDRANKFKKSVKSCTKWLSWHKFKAFICGNLCRDISKSFHRTVQDIKELATTKGGIRANIKRATHIGMVNNALGGVNQKYGTNYTAIDVAKGAIKAKQTADNATNKVNQVVNAVKGNKK